ncbi:MULTISPECIES: hypothetical protein [Salinibaculum]|uniref:hypothetical protein n=1 Tax=Salinibaculum TaxID=2732368 RepID=UPI0030CAE1F7
MDPRRRALAVDFVLAAGGTAVGALGLGGSPAWSVGIAAFGFAFTVCGLFLAEQTPLLTLVDEHTPLSLLVGFGAVLAVGLVLVLGWTVVASPAATLLVGSGVGLGSYRAVYGLVRPVPETRLAQAGGVTENVGSEGPF